MGAGALIGQCRREHCGRLARANAIRSVWRLLGEHYEIEEVPRVVAWFQAHPDGLLLDVGCAAGLYSLIALSVSSESSAVAFDPDLASLKAAQRMCAFCLGRRLTAVHGFVANQHDGRLDLAAAARQTQQRLSDGHAGGALGEPTHRCFDEGRDRTTPVHALDGLWNDDGNPDRPILLKCDVEGAEQLVLQGATRLLSRGITIALSVHPSALPSHGHSVETVALLIRDAGYGVEKLSSDHEEHWWCEASRDRIEAADPLPLA